MGPKVHGPLFGCAEDGLSQGVGGVEVPEGAVLAGGVELLVLAALHVLPTDGLNLRVAREFVSLEPILGQTDIAFFLDFLSVFAGRGGLLLSLRLGVDLAVHALHREIASFDVPVLEIII